jgi:S-adenosyl methyltransferase
LRVPAHRVIPRPEAPSGTGRKENRWQKARRRNWTPAWRYLAAEADVRQFLDIGTGSPTANNIHQVAQSVTPQARVVYADNDPP